MPIARGFKKWLFAVTPSPLHTMKAFSKTLSVLMHSLLIVSCIQEYLEVLVRRPMSLLSNANDPTIHTETYPTMVNVWPWMTMMTPTMNWMFLWGRICTQHCCNNLLWLQRACKRKALCTFTTRALWYFHSTQRKKDIQPRRGDHHQNQFEARNGLLPSMALASTTMTWKKGS